MTATLTRPAWHWVPEHATSTAGGEAADLAASVGIDMDPEQRLLLDAALAERADGSWAAFEFCAIEPRQNGKTAALEMAALHDVFVRDVGRVIWTAHRFKTTSDSFAELAALCENFDHLRRRVKAVRRGANEQAIVLTSGSRIDFLARTGGGGRGLSGDVVVLDEALYLRSDMMGALLPTLSARQNPQVRYASSAGVVESGVLRGVRDRGRAGSDPSLVYVEWATQRGGCQAEQCDHRVGIAGCALDDEDRWRAANPAIGRRMTVDHLRAERRALEPHEFARERLGWWEDPAEFASEIPLPAWDRCGMASAAPGDPVTLAFDVSPGFASGAIVACGTGHDGRPVVEVVEHHAGTTWLVQRLAGLQEGHGSGPVAFDPAGPAGSLQPELAAAGVRVDALSSARVTQACGAFVAAVLDEDVTHRQEASLTAAVGAARRRTAGDAWKWSRKDSTADISPLVAATIARHVWAERGDPQPQVVIL